MEEGVGVQGFKFKLKRTKSSHRSHILQEEPEPSQKPAAQEIQLFNLSHLPVVAL